MIKHSNKEKSEVKKDDRKLLIIIIITLSITQSFDLNFVNKNSRDRGTDDINIILQGIQVF